jgi:hypothetical protein
MGRTYAGILGLTVFSTTLIRGGLAGSSADDVILTATILLFAFAAIGWIVGSIAEMTVIDSVRTRFNAEMKAAELNAKSSKLKT